MTSSATSDVTPRFREELENFWNVTRSHFGNTTIFDDRTLSNESTISQHDKGISLPVVIPIMVLYVVMLLTGLIGNIATCVVIARNKSMQTATNYYLCSLAMTDLLMLMSGLPMEMWTIWNLPYIFGETLCILQSFAAETSANATILTITAFTVER